MGRPRLKDPVDEGNVAEETQALEDGIQSLDISGLNVGDFKPIKQAAAKRPHPFVGYPEKKAKIGELEVRLTHIIALTPQFAASLFQDSSGGGVTIINPKTKEERLVNLYTPHSRFVIDFEGGGRNVDIVFDRKLMLGDGELRCAIVKSPSARSQIMFRLDKVGKVQVDNRYLLADAGQVSRLRQTFFDIVHPQLTAAERAAKRFDAEEETAA